MSPRRAQSRFVEQYEKNPDAALEEIEVRLSSVIDGTKICLISAVVDNAFDEAQTFLDTLKGLQNMATRPPRSPQDSNNIS